MLLAIEISLIIVSVALITSVVLQSKGAGLGGLTGQESGGVYTARRGIERTLFWVTMALSILFFILAFIAIIISA
jgi:preprotein translocase subunit SecG